MISPDLERETGVIGTTANGSELYRNEGTMRNPQLGAATRMLFYSFRKFVDWENSTASATLKEDPIAQTLTFNGLVGRVVIRVCNDPENPLHQVSVTSPTFKTQINTPLAVQLAVVELVRLQTGLFPETDYEDLLRIHSNPKPPVR